MDDVTRRPLRRSAARLVFDIRSLRIAGQLVAIVLMVLVAAYLADNYQANVSDRNIRSGWGFLDEPTGFGIPNADFRPGQPVRDALWIGITNTALSAAAGIVIATVIGVLVGVLRLSSSWVARQAATLYVEVLRNVPVLLIILFTAAWLRTLPRNTDAWTVGSFIEISNRSFEMFGTTFFIEYVAIVLALGLYHGSHIAEIVRGSIQAVPYGQTEAATAIGLSPLQQLRFVVLPQAVRRVIPPLLNDFISLQKDTALIAVLGPIEAARAAAIYGADRFNYSSFVVAAFLFILLTIPLARFTDHLIERDRRRRRAGAVA
jgi:polar amino acid transport system permease protein